MLRPGPVKAAFALAAFALQRLAVLVNRREHALCEALLPADRRSEDPLHLMIAADLHDTLMACRQDNRIIGRIVVNGVDVRPVASRARTRDVAELVALIHVGEVRSRKRLTGLRRIDVEAHGPLIERLNERVAIRIENVIETEIINHAAVRIHFNNHVANGMDALVVPAAIVSHRDAQEAVAILGIVISMREVSIRRRKLAVENFAAHQVILDPALTEAPRQSTVLGLLEAHHEA